MEKEAFQAEKWKLYKNNQMENLELIIQCLRIFKSLDGLNSRMVMAKIIMIALEGKSVEI